MVPGAAPTYAHPPKPPSLWALHPGPRVAGNWPVVSFTHGCLIFQGNSPPTLVRVSLAVGKQPVRSPAGHLISEEASEEPGPNGRNKIGPL